jgi:hypothetical protein
LKHGASVDPAKSKALIKALVAEDCDVSSFVNDSEKKAALNVGVGGCNGCGGALLDSCGGSDEELENAKENGEELVAAAVEAEDVVGNSSNCSRLELGSKIPGGCEDGFFKDALRAWRYFTKAVVKVVKFTQTIISFPKS